MALVRRWQRYHQDYTAAARPRSSLLQPCSSLLHCKQIKGHCRNIAAVWPVQLVSRVLQAVVLECMRGAYRQKRQCFLYAFGGPGDVKEMELDLNPDAMVKLLAFLRFSFGGGTDVDRPLELSLDRLEHNDWRQV